MQSQTADSQGISLVVELWKRIHLNDGILERGARKVLERLWERVCRGGGEVLGEVLGDPVIQNDH